MEPRQVLKARLRAVDSKHLAIARGMLWVAFFVFVGKIAGAAKEMAIAWRYGVSPEVDAYLFVFNLVNWPVSVWFGVLSVVLVPLAADIRYRSPRELPRFRAELFGFAVVTGVALAILVWLGLPWILRTGLAGLSGEGLNAALQMVPILAWLAPLGVLIGLFSTWLLAAGRHVNTLLEGVPALTLLLVLLAVPGTGTEPLVIGTLAGFTLHLASLTGLLGRSGEIEVPRVGFASTAWVPFWRGFGVLLIGQSLMSFTGIIDQFFATRLGEGALATLGYANRILALILGLGATAISRATLPVFSKSNAEGDGNLQRTARHWVRIMFFLGIGALFLGWWLAPWGVKILFERGAFTAQDTHAVAEVFRYGLVQLPFYFAALVYVSLLTSNRCYFSIAIVAGLNLVTKIIFNSAFIPIMGVQGLVFSTALMYAISTIALWRLTLRLRGTDRLE